VKKNQLEFLKKQSVQFGFSFISLKLKKPNRIQTEKTKKKRAKPEKIRVKLNQTRTARFELIWLLFLIKTEPNRK
jgi:methionine-rich copper-binding protein CopC